MYYDVATLGTITSESNTIIAKSSDNGTKWQPYIFAGTNPGQYQLNTTNKTVTVYGLSSFSYFSLSDITAPLPVNLTSFSAVTTGRDVKLSWITSQELNNKGFAIEKRTSFNNAYGDWIQIAFINGHGNSNVEQLYSYSDIKLFSGKYQYRLKQIDYSGSSEYYSLNSPSEIVIGTPVNFSLFQNYPNPSNPNTKIDYQLPFSGKVVLKVYDITGKEVATLVNGAQDAGFYSVDFNGEKISSGVYFYKLIAEGNSQKFSKTMKMILTK